jgi:hypothetical protein
MTALITIYAITWVLETIGLAFFWGMPGPALCGFFGMGAMLTWSLLKIFPRLLGGVNRINKGDL